MILVYFALLRSEVSHEIVVSRLYCPMSGTRDGLRVAGVKRGWLIGLICENMVDRPGRVI
jgi:hypothetical protein